MAASAHIITTVIGLGFLSLAWFTAQLGWIAGPTVLFLFSFVTYYTSTLLASCYRSGDPVTGKRNYTYMDAVRAYLGGVQVKLCGAVQYLNLLGIAIGYTILSYISMMGKEKSNYFHTKGHDSPCHVSSNSYAYMIAFGVVQIFLSQIPDFDPISWLSNVAAVMSFTYYAIGLGLAISKVAENGRIKGSLTRVSIGVVTEMQKVWRSFQTLGAIHYKKKKDFPMELPTNFFGSALPTECRRICRRLCVTDETKHVRHRRNQARKHFVKNCRLFTDGQCLIDEQDERYRKQQQRYDEQNLLEQIYRSLRRDDRPPRP